MEEESTSQEIRSVYTLADIDKFTLSQIENGKTQFLVNLNTFSGYKAREQLQDLFSIMQTMLEKYFDKELIEKKTIDGYNFYELKKAINRSTHLSTMRKASEIGFTIYNQFLKQIGVEIPTARADVKKK